jgi:hypothetical protein
MTAHRDIVYATRARRAGAKHALRIIREARQAGLGERLSLAFGLVEQESNFENVFGHDHGAWRPADGKVTKANVQELLFRIRHKHQPSNGVGLPQLTFPGFILQAEAMGGAHIVKNQLHVAFHVLAPDLHHRGPVGGLAVYNSGDPNSTAGRRYAREVLIKADRWHKILLGKRAVRRIEHRAGRLPR